eukprot:14174509-Heterocapsa_arctica.AAC.1
MGLPVNSTPSDAQASPRVLLAAARRNHVPQAFPGRASAGIAECRPSPGGSRAGISPAKAT